MYIFVYLYVCVNYTYFIIFNIYIISMSYYVIYLKHSLCEYINVYMYTTIYMHMYNIRHTVYVIYNMIHSVYYICYTYVMGYIQIYTHIPMHILRSRLAQLKRKILKLDPKLYNYQKTCWELVYIIYVLKYMLLYMWYV